MSSPSFVLSVLLDCVPFTAVFFPPTFYWFIHSLLLSTVTWLLQKSLLSFLHQGIWLAFHQHNVLWAKVDQTCVARNNKEQANKPQGSVMWTRWGAASCRKRSSVGRNWRQKIRCVQLMGNDIIFALPRCTCSVGVRQSSSITVQPPCTRASQATCSAAGRWGRSLRKRKSCSVLRLRSKEQFCPI